MPEVTGSVAEYEVGSRADAASTEGVSEAPLAAPAEADQVPPNHFDEYIPMGALEPPGEELLEIFREVLDDYNDEEAGPGVPLTRRRSGASRRGSS